MYLSNCTSFTKRKVCFLIKAKIRLSFSTVCDNIKRNRDRQKDVSRMNAFIQNNIIWIVPIAGILLTVIIKISAKPESITLGFTDYLDFGFDLSITSIVILLAGIKDEAGLWLLFLAFLLVMIAAIIVNRVGWKTETNEHRLIGVLLPDFIGVILLVIATLYLGGLIK